MFLIVLNFFLLFYIADTRKYAAYITTTDNAQCETSQDLSYYFLSNCTWFIGGSLQQQYCNTAKSISTSTNTFSPANRGETVYVEFIEDNIGDLGFIFISNPSSDTWCLDSISILMNPITYQWKTCDLGNLMGLLPIDNACNGVGNDAFESITIDLASANTICYDDDTITC